MECETNDCRKEKRGCKGCYYDGVEKIEKMVKDVGETITKVMCREQKTADEMFEELRYKKTGDIICEKYRKQYQYQNGEEIREYITFYKKDKWFSVESFNCDTGTSFSKFIDEKELQAINKKVEELGWK